MSTPNGSRRTKVFGRGMIAYRAVALLAAVAILMAATRHAAPIALAAETEEAKTNLIGSLPDASDNDADLPMVAGEILVGFHADRVLAANVTADLGVRAVEALDLSGREDLYGQILHVAPGQEWAAIELLTQDPAVAFAEPNWIVTASYGEIEAATEIPFPVNDPLYESRQWYLQRMQVSRAWGLTQGATALVPEPATVRVAVIDSGIDGSHPEFSGHLLAGKNYVTPGTIPLDDCGHGTHVAGLIGAAVNNGAGMAGTAINVQIDPRKVLASSCGGSISAVSLAIREAADAGAHVINLSLEAPAPNIIMELAVDYAAGKGALLVASSGNSRTVVQWPAAYAAVMAVGATGYADETVFYSNFGSQIEIAAPGGDAFDSIYSTWSSNAALKCSSNGGDYQIVDGGSYCNAFGTSMSAALVSGAAALVRGIRPDLSAQEVRSILKETATPTGAPATDVGSGRVNLHHAVRRVVPGNLEANPSQMEFVLDRPTAPFTTGLTLQNPSLETIEWQLELDPNLEWIFLPGATDGSESGQVTYGEPIHVPLTISPTTALTQSLGTTLHITGTRDDATQIVLEVPVKLIVGREPYQLLMPVYLATDEVPPAETPSFSWQVPDDPNDRITRGLGDDSRVWITLPFLFPIRDRLYLSGRLYSDGLLSFAESESILGMPTSCLPETAWPHDAIYGWWTDLNPNVAGARVSMFPLESDRFVIEFEDVLVKTAGETISFQMVLHKDGRIKLNYLEVPANLGRMPSTTIGAEALDGRMHNQIYCADGASELGRLPESRQSFLIEAEDIY